ncbi:MAG: hypothetical protein Q8Q21_00435 [bacterium]|nr:hypothetical protein [bacterium]
MCYPTFFYDPSDDADYYEKLCNNAFIFFRDVGEKLTPLVSYAPAIEGHYLEAWGRFSSFRESFEPTMWDTFCHIVNNEICCLKTQISLAKEIKKVARKERTALGQVIFGKTVEMELGCFLCKENCSLKKIKVII